MRSCGKVLTAEGWVGAAVEETACQVGCTGNGGSTFIKNGINTYGPYPWRNNLRFQLLPIILASRIVLCDARTKKFLSGTIIPWINPRAGDGFYFSPNGSGNIEFNFMDISESRSELPWKMDLKIRDKTMSRYRLGQWPGSVAISGTYEEIRGKQVFESL